MLKAMKNIEYKPENYPSDLTEEQWKNLRFFRKFTICNCIWNDKCQNCCSMRSVDTYHAQLIKAGIV
jgi:hypothetical protein